MPNLLSRAAMQSAMTGQYAMKTFAAQFGYAENLTFDDYMNMYRRVGIAKRIVNITTNYTWRTLPNIVGTIETKEDSAKPIIDAIELLNKTFRLFSILKRADRLACIGRYSIVVISTKNDTDLSTELPRGTNVNDISLINAFSEKQAEISTWVNDTTNPRFGLPETYRIKPDGESGRSQTNYTVHHSRIIHIANNKVDSDIYGTPLLEAAFNYIQDLMKVIGSSAEMYWLGAYAGLVFTEDKDLLQTDEQVADMKNAIDEYSNKLRRYLTVKGVEVQPLPSVTPDPTGNVENLVNLISAASDIPTRLLLGSEQGQLASSTDMEMFVSYITGRQETFADNEVLTPFINRLIEYGYIQGVTSDDYMIEWEPLIERNKSDKIKDGSAIITAIRSAVGQVGNVFSVLTKEELRDLMDLAPDIPETDYPDAGNYKPILDEMPTDPSMESYISMRNERRRSRKKLLTKR